MQSIVESNDLALSLHGSKPGSRMLSSDTKERAACKPSFGLGLSRQRAFAPASMLTNEGMAQAADVHRRLTLALRRIARRTGMSRHSHKTSKESGCSSNDTGKDGEIHTPGQKANDDTHTECSVGSPRHQNAEPEISKERRSAGVFAAQRVSSESFDVHSWIESNVPHHGAESPNYMPNDGPESPRVSADRDVRDFAKTTGLAALARDAKGFDVHAWIEQNVKCGDVVANGATPR